MRDCCKMHYNVPTQLITVSEKNKMYPLPLANEALTDEDIKNEPHDTTIS